MSYKIGFLNPWRNCAENQAFNSLRIAAERLGQVMVHCSNSMELEASDPDFVLATSSIQPKLTRHPTFGVIHEGRDRFLLNRTYFTNLLTYDGYLTVSDSVRAFIENALVGVGRKSEIGFFYNVPHKVAFSAPVQELAAKGHIKLTYFGTNWDKRQWELFRHLDRLGLVEVYGPGAAWANLSSRTYRGAVPFDGEAPQRTYANNGAGLVLLSEQHLRDDVISNRIFEIASAGAVAVACDTPWLRNNFGDSVYYFNQHDTPARLAERLREIWFEIHENPDAAADRAKRARAIFEARFCADVLLRNAVDYFEAWRDARSVTNRTTHPKVSVIVRCGGRSLDVLQRALRSLRDQTYGRGSAILVMWRDFDTAALQCLVGGGLAEIKIVRCPGGSRSRTLSAGLQAVDTPYFALLDDDDAWFPTHLERVFEVLQAWPETRLVITGAMQEIKTPFPVLGGGEERRRVHRFGFPTKATRALTISGAFAPNAFVAERALLNWRLLEDPPMATAEDTHLVLGLVGQSPPRFNYAATAIQYESDDGSRFLDDPRRHEDELTLFTRRLSDLDGLIGPEETWRLLSTSLIRAQSSGDATVRSMNGRTVFACSKVDYGAIQIESSPGTTIPLETARVTLGGHSRFEKSKSATAGGQIIQVTPNKQPWASGAAIDLQFHDALPQDGLIVVVGRVKEGVLAFSLYDDAKHPLFTKVLAASVDQFELHVPLVNGSRVGRLVMHNWEDGQRSQALIESVTIHWAGG